MVAKNHAKYLNSEWTWHKSEEVEPVQPVYMNIYQSYIYNKDISWLRSDHEPRIQERQKDQQS